MVNSSRKPRDGRTSCAVGNLFFFRTTKFPPVKARPKTEQPLLKTADNENFYFLRKTTTNNNDSSPRGFLGDLGSARAQDGPSQYRAPCPYLMVTSMLKPSW